MTRRLRRLVVTVALAVASATGIGSVLAHPASSPAKLSQGGTPVCVAVMSLNWGMCQGLYS
jgi:hypothetical protein